MIHLYISSRVSRTISILGTRKRITNTTAALTVVMTRNAKHLFLPKMDRYGMRNHAFDVTLKADCLFRQYIKELAHDILLDPEAVLAQACRQHREAGERCSVEAMKSFIKRVRQQLLPRVPTTIAQLGEVLDEYAPTRAIFQGNVTAGGASATIFASPEMLEFLRQARWLHIDGTFSGYAAVFVLCERRTKLLYDAIWGRILELCPELRENLRAVWSDFDRAAISSLRFNFPRIRIRGCWFHFCRATYRKWKALKMTDPPIEILHLTWNLPLLPVNRFVEGCMAITAMADPLAIGGLIKLNDFTHYLRTQWLAIVDVTSVHGTSIRTNNIAESFNRHSVRKLGGPHPKIWVFLEKLTQTIDDELVKIRRWRETGRTGKRPPHKAWIAADEHIAECHRLLATGRYTVEEFLHAATTPHQREDLHFIAARFSADDERDPDPPLPVDILNPENVYPDDPAQEEVPLPPRARRGRGHGEGAPEPAHNRGRQGVRGRQPLERAVRGGRGVRDGLAVIGDRGGRGGRRGRGARGGGGGGDVRDGRADGGGQRGRGRQLNGVISDDDDTDNSDHAAEEIGMIRRRAWRRIIDSDTENDEIPENVDLQNIEPAHLDPDNLELEILNEPENQHAEVIENPNELENLHARVIENNNDPENVHDIEILNDLVNVGNGAERFGGNRRRVAIPEIPAVQDADEPAQLRQIDGIAGGSDNDDIQVILEDPRPNNVDNAINGGGAAEAPRKKDTRARKKNQRKKRRRQSLAEHGGNLPENYGRKRKRQKKNQAPKCIVCRVKPITHIIYPCGHICCCGRCAKTLAEFPVHERRICPKCREPIKDFLKAYLEA